MKANKRLMLANVASAFLPTTSQPRSSRQESRLYNTEPTASVSPVATATGQFRYAIAAIFVSALSLFFAPGQATALDIVATTEPIVQGSGVGMTARYENVATLDGTSLDLFAEMLAYTPAGSPCLFTIEDDDIKFQFLDGEDGMERNATVRWTFYENGTTNPVTVPDLALTVVISGARSAMVSALRTSTSTSEAGTIVLPIQVVAESLDTSIVTDSLVEVEVLNADTIALRAPEITIVGPDVTIDPVTDYGDTPVGARIYYTVDGSDPGDLNGVPTSGILYTGPFPVASAGGNPIKARVYAPDTFEQWFVTSLVTTETPPILVITFTMTVSTSAP